MDKITARIVTKETREKISKALKGKMPKNISLIAGWNKGKHLSEETKKKLSLVQKGKKLSEKHRQNIIKSLIGNKRTLGFKQSEETKQKHRDKLLGNKNPNYGGLSHNHRKNISLSKVGSKMHPNTRKALMESYKERYPDWEFHDTRLKEKDERRRSRLKQNGGNHTRNEWKEMKEKNNYSCLCCGKKEPEIKLTKDHIIPIIKGGPNDIKNIQPLCTRCNIKKHTKIVRYTNAA